MLERVVLSHPSDKNKYVVRMGHPEFHPSRVGKALEIPAESVSLVPIETETTSACCADRNRQQGYPKALAGMVIQAGSVVGAS
jgi:hypothetical protein